MAVEEKTTEKTTAIPQQHGGSLNSGGTPGNSGGKKGKSGRPPKAFKEFCAALSKDNQFQARLKRTSKDPEHKNYIGAVKIVVEHAEGKPAQQVHVSGKLDVDVIDSRAVLAEKLTRLLEGAPPSGEGGGQTP